MKINTSFKSPGSSGIKESAPRTSKSGAGDAAAQKKAAPQDSVQITSRSSQLHAMESAMDNVPVVDMARVAAIKQAISEGQFKINPEAIADKLIATVKDFVQNQKG